MCQHSAPVSVALARQLVWQNLGAAHPMEAHRVDSRYFQDRGRSADAKEGINAFLEKRDATFADRVSDGMPACFPSQDEPPFE
jgi:enoyl-CoA hydratase/carnithine racemase